MRLPIAFAAATLVVSAAAQAGTFVNPGFEAGSLAGWTVGGGVRSVDNGTENTSYLADPAAFLPGGAHYVEGAGKVDIVTAGVDPLTGLPRVLAGQAAAVVADRASTNNISVLAQTINNYNATSLSFSWAAVLGVRHDFDDASYVSVTLRDLTAGTTLYSSGGISAPDGPVQPGFTASADGAYIFSQWNDVSVANIVRGHDLALYLLAADCPFGANDSGHPAWLYVDSLMTAGSDNGNGNGNNGSGNNGNGGTNPGQVPEPGTLALVGLALGALGLRARRRQA